MLLFSLDLFPFYPLNQTLVICFRSQEPFACQSSVGPRENWLPLNELKKGNKI